LCHRPAPGKYSGRLGTQRAGDEFQGGPDERDPAPTADSLADPDLLDGYAREHDQEAFAALVRRYGPLVLGVALRQLADRHRAEDVFQATFLACPKYRLEFY
jgi:Sigma-70 region 2